MSPGLLLGGLLLLTGPAQASPDGVAVATMGEIAPAVSSCWRVPPALRGFERLEVTARFSLKRDGGLIGPPLVTFATGEVPSRARELLTRSVRDAIRACTPLNLTEGLGLSVAGRPLSIRFIHHGPKGRGA